MVIYCERKNSSVFNVIENPKTQISKIPKPKNLKNQKSKNIKKPKALIANTIKGKGFSFSENNNEWHHKILTKSTYENALKEIKKIK